jgi:hypothetical protein
MGSQIVTKLEQARGKSELTGMRDVVTKTAKEHAKAAPEEMRAILSDHVRPVCELVAREAARGDRTALRIFFEVMGAIGAKGDMIQALVVAVGAQSPEHLKSAASIALDAEQVDDETAYVQALDFVTQYRRQNGLPALVEVDERYGEVPGA